MVTAQQTTAQVVTAQQTTAQVVTAQQSTAVSTAITGLQSLSIMGPVAGTSTAGAQQSGAQGGAQGAAGVQQSGASGVPQSGADGAQGAAGAQKKRSPLKAFISGAFSNLPFRKKSLRFHVNLYMNFYFFSCKKFFYVNSIFSNSV